MSLIDIFFIVIPLIIAMIVALLVSLKMLRREYYWAVIPFAAIAMITLLLTA